MPVPVLGGAVHGPAQAGPVGVWCREHGVELGDALGDHHASVPVMGQLGHRAVVSEVHRGEVGDAALQSAAGQGCPPRFAAYVGIDFTASRLDILPVIPTQVAWQAGTREISCVALTTDGTKLTGSVKGSGK